MIQTRSNLPLKYVGLILILIAFAGASIHLVYSQMETFEFTIETDKSAYILGEPVAVDFNLKNISPDPVDTDLFPPYDRGIINIMITQIGNDPTNFISEKMNVGMTKIFSPISITLNPGESTTSTEFISFNRLTGELAFPVPAEYQIQANLIVGEEGVIESNIINIIVTDVTGMDGDALSFLEANGLLMFLTPEVQSAPESLDPNLINKANEFLINFPVSIYSDFVSSALAAIAEVPIPECPPSVMGTYPDCDVIPAGGSFEFSAKGQRSDVNKFLTYEDPRETTTSLPSGTTSFDLRLLYGETVLRNTFSAVLNNVDITSNFHPFEGFGEQVTIDLQEGRNVLKLTIDGIRTDGHTATERDRLVFKVG